jgi:L-alanine-DL-glutamate epimerase-like enolase superfamily enzyme
MTELKVPAAPTDRARIASVSATAVVVPLNTPVRWATREVSAREYVFVRVSSTSGRVGVGYTYAGMHTARSLAMYIDDVMAPRLIDLPENGPTRPWADLYQESILMGRRGFALRAISAIDVALWDLMGQVTGQPVSAMLGGVHDSVPAYASGGYYRPGDPLANIEREISHYLELGFHDVKIKVGGLAPEVDAARVELTRSLVGPSGRVALDANNAWSYPFQVIRFARMVEPFDPWWLEEPLAVDDIAGHAEVARVLDMPVATGEIHSARWDFRDLIQSGAADILQPDAAVLGGVSEWMKVAHAAATFGFPVAPHWNHDLHVHLAAAVANCLAVEWFDAEQDIVNFDRLLAEPMRPEHGVLAVPDRPGLGLVVDWDAVERFRVPHGGPA